MSMKRSIFIKLLFFSIFLIVCSLSGYSQDLLKGKDLSQIKVDQLTPSEISTLKSQLNSSGLTLDQAEQMAISKGMPASEASKLKQRLSSNNAFNIEKSNEKVGEPKSAEKTNNSSETLDTYKSGKSLINPLIFGSELYTGTSPSFEPNQKMATPVNYILGPDDHIAINVYGIQEYSADLLVSSEGTVNIPNVGQIRVGGMTIESATSKLKTAMGNSAYSYLKTGGAKLSVTLSKIRSISITIIGSVRPGNYKVSSLSSVFNALYIAGGPSSYGSFREIELLRDNKLEKKIDLYKFMIYGDQSENVALKDNDVIRIPPYKTRVEIKGEVKREGIYEMLQGENFTKLLSFASGFTDTAYEASVKVLQRNEKERMIYDLVSEKFNTYFPKSADQIIVSKISDRYKNRVTIKGAVMRPDIYELREGMTVLDLIKMADGLKEDAYLLRAKIIRLEKDLTKSVLSFNLKKMLEGDVNNNFILNKEDEIIISSVSELKEREQVTVQGEIRKPGVYDFVHKMTLKDLILQSGGFTNASNQKVEVARIIKRDSLLSQDLRSSELIKTLIVSGNFGDNSYNIELEPYDVITVRRMAGYYLPISVSISGQVQFPGPYSVESRNEKISDLIKRAGGFSPEAFPEGAYLKRFKTAIEKEVAVEALEKINKTAKDTASDLAKDVLKEFDKIPLNINAILKNPGSLEDFILKSNDEVVIPKFDAQVKISGEILVSTQVIYSKDKKFNDYINEAGGFTSNALKRKSYVVYANGKASATKSFLFFKNYPTILPGCEVVIPKEREKKTATTGEIIGIASALASLAGVTIAILKL